MKFRVLGTAPSREQIVRLVNEYYCSRHYIMGEETSENHYKIVNELTYRHTNTCIRYYRKRWQFGSYEEV